MSETVLLDHCDLPSCEAVSGADVLISADGGLSVWCLDHLLDDWLPVLTTGVLGGCIHCHTMCLTWAEAGCLHDRCRRGWAMGRPPETGSAVNKHGAYGRRDRSA
jgi:hypothetical protein